MKNTLKLLLFITLLPASMLLNADDEVSNGDIDTCLKAPLRMSNNNLLHSLILIPPLESAERINEGTKVFQTGVEYTRFAFKNDKDSWLMDYNASLKNGFIDYRVGLSKSMELRLDLTGGILAEGKRELLLLDGNAGYLSGDRGLGLSNLVLGIKHKLWESLGADEEIPYTSALSIQFKKPFGNEEDLLSSGGNDVSIAYLETDKIDEATFAHFQLGCTFTGKATAFSQDLDIANPLFYSAGISWLVSENTALSGQLQGHGNAFREIKTLTRNPITVQCGFRYKLPQGQDERQYIIDTGFGWGLNGDSSDFMMMFSLGKVY
ncbi:MAG: hypothetical protein HY811_11275 [Planctomycetes bacterium]|nr:hypothetical protein [Planctomycetota bacterium]